jgi:hypothetical protein
VLELPRPHPAQEEILRSGARFNVVACGRRFGKTVVAQLRAIRPALEGYPVGWFAPSFKILNPAQEELMRLLRPVTRRSNLTQRVVELVTGGSIEFCSLSDAEVGRSRRYKHVVVDEAALVRKLEKAWTGAIRPTLSDYQGTADFYSTPRGRDFFWRAFTWGQDPHKPAWASWHRPTAANPYIDPREIEDARAELPERMFRQEYLAEFLDDAGGVFREVAGAVTRGRTRNEPPEPGRTYALGVDLARVHDFTVIVVLDDAGRQVFLDRFHQTSWEAQIARICETAQRYGARVLGDFSGLGDPIFERIQRAGVQVTAYPFTNADKEKLIDNLALQLEQGKLQLLDHAVQENELLAYQYELTAHRNVRTGAPEGQHDDCVIALALAAWALKARRQLRVW